MLHSRSSPIYLPNSLVPFFLRCSQSAPFIYTPLPFHSLPLLFTTRTSTQCTRFCNSSISFPSTLLVFQVFYSLGFIPIMSSAISFRVLTVSSSTVPVPSSPRISYIQLLVSVSYRSSIAYWYLRPNCPFSRKTAPVCGRVILNPYLSHPSPFPPSQWPSRPSSQVSPPPHPHSWVCWLHKPRLASGD